MGVPSVLTTDQGKEFHNEINRLLMESFQIDHRLTTAYHPQANGLDERFNQTLCNAIAKVTGEEHDTWDERIPESVYAYNTSVQVSDTSNVSILHKFMCLGRCTFVLVSLICILLCL